jgi:hypothetical protein
MKNDETPNQTCAHCGKKYYESDFSALSRAIMDKKPVCSYECNVALGQVKPPKEAK